MRYRQNFVVALVAALAALVSSTAHAGTQGAACTADKDCDKGFNCQVVGSTACPGIACTPGQTCPAAPACTPTDVKACEPGPCSTDADCATDMLCYATNTSKCAVPPVAPCTQDPCPKPEPTTCTPTTMNLCTPRYLVPCKLDADCGAHFTCVASQECNCTTSSGSSSGSGGSATPGAGAGSSPVPPPAALDAGPGKALDAGVTATTDAGPSCECKPSDTKRCKLEQIPCTGSAQCPTSWSCVRDVATTDVACVGFAGVDAGPCAQQPTTTTTQNPGVCAPPYAPLPGAAKAGAAPTNDTAIGQTANSGHAIGDAGASTSPEAGTGKSKSSGGICSVTRVGPRAASHVPSVLWLLALSGLVLARRRRSPRR